MVREGIKMEHATKEKWLVAEFDHLKGEARNPRWIREECEGDAMRRYVLEHMAEHEGHGRVWVAARLPGTGRIWAAGTCFVEHEDRVMFESLSHLVREV